MTLAELIPSIKIRIRSLIKDMVVRVITKKNQPVDDGADSASSGSGTGGGSGYYSEEDIVPTTLHRSTASDLAEHAMTEWEQLPHQHGLDVGDKMQLTPDDLLTALPFERLLEWWRDHASKQYPMLVEVAMSLFAMEGAAAAIERDFCVSGKILTAEKSSTDGAAVDMMMFIRGIITGKAVVIPDDFAPHLKVMTEAEVAAVVEDVRSVPGEGEDDLDSDVGEDPEDAEARISSVLDDGDSSGWEDEEEPDEEEGASGRRPMFTVPARRSRADEEDGVDEAPNKRSR